MAVQQGPSLHHLFGGTRSWDTDSWQASDDRVRGGKSQSHLEQASPSSGSEHGSVRFYGNLDITTLGGAGFASQRTSDSRSWDLTDYTGGLHLKIANGDGKKYTLILKDEILPRRSDGREQSSVSWEYDFLGRAGQLAIRWDELKPTYRGKAKPDAEPLDLANVKRFSIMMRSFFGSQQGDFDLELISIAAVKDSSSSSSGASSDTQLRNDPAPAQSAKDNSWFGWIKGMLRL